MWLLLCANVLNDDNYVRILCNGFSFLLPIFLEMLFELKIEICLIHQKKQKRNSSSHPISWDEFCGLTNGLTIFLPIFDIFCGNFHNTMPIIQLNVCIFCGERIHCAKKLCNGRESSLFLICQPIYFVCSKVNNTRTFVNHIFNSREIKKNYTHCSLISI